MYKFIIRLERLNCKMKIFINICENIQLICFRFTDVTDSTLFLQVDLSSYDKIIIFGVFEMVSLADIS